MLEETAETAKVRFHHAKVHHFTSPKQLVETVGYRLPRF